MAEETLSARLVEIESMLERSRRRFEEGARLVEEAQQLMGEIQQALIGSPKRVSPEDSEEAASRLLQSLKASGGNIAPGCKEVGAGLAVPKVNGNYDFTTLKTCAAHLKGSNSEFADETAATISANPGVDFQTVVGVMDALRETPAGDALFEDIKFGVAR